MVGLIHHHHHHTGATACFQANHRLVDHTPLFLFPGDGLVQLEPGHWESILVASYHTHGLHWSYYCSPSVHRNALMEAMCVWFEPTPIFLRKRDACQVFTHLTLRIKFDR